MQFVRAASCKESEMKGDPTRHDVCQLFEESGCRHAGHVVSWGMEGHASNASNPTTSGLAGSPTTDHHQTSDQALFCAAMIHGVTTWGWILTSSSFQLGPSIKFWLCLAGRGPSCGAPNYWPLSPAQFETNHPKTRWASGGRWRMEENTNSEIQSQDWYNQVADEKKPKIENLEIKENGTCSLSPIQSKH